MSDRTGDRVEMHGGGEPVLDIDRYVIHGATTVRAGRPLLVQTSPEPWAYAISFVVSCPTAMSSHDAMVRVGVRVTEGEVSLVCVAVDGLRVIDEEFVRAFDAVTRKDLVTAPLSACGQVVLRNARTDGKPSTLAVHSVECLDLGDPNHSEGLPSRPTPELTAVPNWHKYYGYRGTTLEERLRSARYAVLDRVERVQWLENLNLLIYPNDELSRAVYISETYEPGSLLAMRALLPVGGVFLDVGANNGVFSMLASRWVGPQGRVFSFEPSEREFHRLREHIELNRLTNVTAIRKVVADRDDWFHLRVARFPHAGHNTIGVTFAYDGVRIERTECIEGVTLTTFVNDTGLSRIDLVKVDVEGAERAVLAGAQALLHHHRPSWIIEVCDATLAACGTTAGQVLDRFREASYRLLRVDTASGALVQLLSGDNIPAGNVIAVPVERELPRRT
jgi:FkbM family methyltransferase